MLGKLKGGEKKQRRKRKKDERGIGKRELWKRWRERKVE